MGWARRDIGEVLGDQGMEIGWEEVLLAQATTGWKVNLDRPEWRLFVETGHHEAQAGLEFQILLLPPQVLGSQRTPPDFVCKVVHLTMTLERLTSTGEQLVILKELMMVAYGALSGIEQSQLCVEWRQLRGKADAICQPHPAGARTSVFAFTVIRKEEAL